MTVSESAEPARDEGAPPPATEPSAVPDGEGRWQQLPSRLAIGLMAGWLALLVEFLVVAVAQRAQMASVWEIQYGLLGLSPSWLVLGVIPGLFGGWTLWLLEGAERPRNHWLLVTSWALVGVAVGWGIGGGRHLAALSIRAGFALGVGIVFAAVVHFLGPWIARRYRAAQSGGLALITFVLAVAAVALASALVNRFVLVRLYPAFHVGLSLITLASAGVAVGPAWSRPGSGGWLGAAVCGGLLVVAGLAWPLASRSVAGFDNFRLILSEHSPTLRLGVELAARVAPPSEANCGDSDPDCLATIGASKPSSMLDWSGRDIVLITVDALRADHLGAYGYERDITPSIDALAREGALFDHAYAPTPHTSYSVTSLMTGKYMRPLLLQGAGDDSDTWADLLRRYGYRTAAFYPPAVFFIDPNRFAPFEKNRLGFEYSKVEFAEGEKRLGQIREYLGEEPGAQRLFLWLHLFGPHEPYEAHPGLDFGPRDVDRYDSEVAFADRTIGEVVRTLRARNPKTVVIVTADHGEEFGEHGGRYHGTSVYEEQVRVPLVISAPDSIEPRRIDVPVQTIDLLPTTLGALRVPRPARIRGRDLGTLLGAATEPNAAQADPADADDPSAGFALAETEEQSLLVEGRFRLVCARRIGACKLYDIIADPAQAKDMSSAHREEFERLRKRSRALAASHGRFEERGLRAEGKGWPAAVLRGISGDGEAAPELAMLLDDADVEIRRKAAELLFELARESTAAALRLTLTRDEDVTVRRFCALALTRLGEGAPLVYEMVEGDDRAFRRLAALALAESGDARGEAELVAWWRTEADRDFDRSRQILKALSAIKAEDAVWPLIQSLDDVRLRPEIAETLATIGDKDARGYLLRALREERYQSTRTALVDAIVRLGGEEELAAPLVRFLGVPDPLQGGLSFALRAGILKHVGGPKDRQVHLLRHLSDSGVKVNLVVPPGGNGKGARFLVRARTRHQEPGAVYVQQARFVPRKPLKEGAVRYRNLPEIDSKDALRLEVRPTEEFREMAVDIPVGWKVRAGHALSLVVFAERTVELEALAVVPLADELPPPAPKPWSPEQGSDSKGAADAGDASKP